MPRVDGRESNELRQVSIEPGFLEFAEGSALIKVGRTTVVCSATIEERVPQFIRGQGRGWITAEYSMLPRATLSRTDRSRSSLGGRTMEIQRLIGRSLRSVVQSQSLGERTITLDCDVIQADGGTRTAAVTGAYVALYQSLIGLVRKKILHHVPIDSAIAATSVGVVQGELLLDLCYEEDASADVDFNVVMSDKGEFVEIQGTGEDHPFSRDQMNNLLTLAEDGIKQLIHIQKEVVNNL